MNIVHHLVLLLAVTTFSASNSYGDTFSNKNDHADASMCMGWAAEVSELAAALHDQIDPTREKLTNLLYDLESLTEEKCYEDSNKEQVDQDIAKTALALKKEVFNHRGVTSAELVLTNALLKLIGTPARIDLSSIN